MNILDIVKNVLIGREIVLIRMESGKLSLHTTEDRLRALGGTLETHQIQDVVKDEVGVWIVCDEQKVHVPIYMEMHLV